MKRVLFLFTILLCLSGCTKNSESKGSSKKTEAQSKNQSSPQFLNIAKRLRKLYFTDDNGVVTQIIFTGPKADDLTSAVYEFYKDYTLIMSGNLKMTKDEFYLEYPDTILDNSDSPYLSAWLETLFPGKSNSSILTWDPDILDLEAQRSGAYEVNGINFIDTDRSVTLTKFTMDGYNVTSARMDITVTEDTYFYDKPDFSANKISITKNPVTDYTYANDRRILNQKLEIIKKDFAMPVVEGVRLKVRATFVPKDKSQKNWYYVKTDTMTDSKYAWINGKYISFKESPDISKRQFESFVKRLEKEGLVKIVKADTDKLPAEVECIDIESLMDSYFFYNDNKIWIVNGDTGLYTTLPRSALAVDSDGYLKLKYNDYSMLFISGGINQVFRDFKNDGENTYDDPDKNENFHNKNIKSITASSSFEETLKGKPIKYTPDNLGKAFEVGCKCHPYWWNYNHIPWVEGVKGNGIGEFITVEFTEPVVELELINGYSDIRNMKLYKENARVKTFELEDLENNITKTILFEDYVYFNKVILDKPTSKIRLTIKDVYPGTKYQDTCFSSILATSYKSYSSDKKQNAEILKKLYVRLIEVSPDEFFKVQTKFGL